MEPAVFPVAKPRIPPRFILILAASLVVFFALAFFLPESLSPVKQWILLVPVLGVLTAGLTVFNRFMLMLTTDFSSQIALTSSSVQFRIGRDIIHLPYSDITSVVVGSRKSDRTEYIRLKSPNHSMLIEGYENMDALRDSLAVLQKPMVIRRAVMTRPQTGVVQLFAAWIPLAFALAFMPKMIRALVLGLFCLSIGLFCVIGKPLSRRGAGFRFAEWYLFVAWIVGGVLTSTYMIKH